MRFITAEYSFYKPEAKPLPLLAVNTEFLYTKVFDYKINYWVQFGKKFNNKSLQKYNNN